MRQLKAGYRSVTGNVRENNEDRCYVDPLYRFFLVADGMGGQSAGEKASQIAVEIVPKRLDQQLDFLKANADRVIRAVDSAVAEANTEIMALGELDPAFNKMGTTLVFLLAAGGEMFAGGVGDSRVYQLRGKTLTQLTTDHSLTQALLDAGTITPEEAVNHKYRNMLYRYLGCKEGGAGTNPARVNPESGDRFMLCSDGVLDGIDDPEIQALLAKHADPQQAADAIVNAALDAGSKDNVTCVVVHVT